MIDDGAMDGFREIIHNTPIRAILRANLKLNFQYQRFHVDFYDGCRELLLFMIFSYEFIGMQYPTTTHHDLTSNRFSPFFSSHVPSTIQSLYYDSTNLLYTDGNQRRVQAFLALARHPCRRRRHQPPLH